MAVEDILVNSGLEFRRQAAMGDSSLGLTVYKLLLKPWEWVKSSKERPEEHRVGVMEGPTAETCVQDKPAKQAQRQQRGWGKCSCKIQGEECQKLTARCRLLNRILSKRSQGLWDPMD